MLTFEQVRDNDEVKALIKGSGDVLTAMQYTEHGIRHATYVSYTAGKILQELGYSEREVELAKIAGYLHDIGNIFNRHNHGVNSSLIVYDLLKRLGMSIEEVITVCSAIGNHEEEIGSVVNNVGAALVIADKSDAHKTRVKLDNFDPKDIHDRVNFSIKKNIVMIDADERIIKSKFYMEDSSSVMEYFEIYLSRIIMSEKAAHFLKCSFSLYFNDVLINSPFEPKSK
ncbi:MAG: HD domain-containing protein [Clostridia bacterium]